MARAYSRPPRTRIRAAVSAMGTARACEGGALEDAPQQPSEQGQAADARDDLEQADEHGGRDAQAARPS